MPNAPGFQPGPAARMRLPRPDMGGMIRPGVQPPRLANPAPSNESDPRQIAERYETGNYHWKCCRAFASDVTSWRSKQAWRSQERNALVTQTMVMFSRLFPRVLIYYGGIILCFKSSRSVAKNSFHSEESDAEAGYRECIFRLGTVVSRGGLRLFRRDWLSNVSSFSLGGSELCLKVQSPPPPWRRDSFA